MRILLALVLLSGVAAADKAPAKCKRSKIDRHVTCEITAPIIVGTTAPKPGVLIVHSDDGKKVTGRPKSDDRFGGLSHQLH